MKNLTTTQQEFVSVAKEMFGDDTTQVSRQDVIKMINDLFDLLRVSHEHQ